ncbi:hypothetical protein BH11PLA1_BH11PLA1_06630 [soil metagenome]
MKIFALIHAVVLSGLVLMVSAAGAFATPAHIEPATATAHTAAVESHAGHEPVGAMADVKQGIATGVTALVVFLIVAAFLQFFVWPKISAGLNDRENKIKGEIEAAEQARAQAKSALEMYQKNLAEANTKAQQMIVEAKAGLQVQLAEQRARADTEAAQAKDKAIREIEAAKKQALSEIYSQTATLATSVAGRILQREVQSQDAERFTQEALSNFRQN